MRKNISEIDFTTNLQALQLKLNLNTEVYVKDNGKVLLVQDIIERMALKEVLKLYQPKGRNPIVDPITMLEILLFCYSEGCFSARNIEDKCRYDLRVLYLLNGQKAPDHATIHRFRKKVAPLLEGILEQFTLMLVENGLLDLSSVYIDGTKIESVSNKYRFVWRGSVEKHQAKLQAKIRESLSLSAEASKEDLRKAVKKARNHCRQECKKQKIVFVYGSGKRKTEVQREYEKYEEWLEKLNSYEKHLAVMGERNSYAKTDPDATFMRMKEDHMRNGQLKPAYNIQCASSGYFIVGSYASHHPSDRYTLPLFVEKLTKSYGKLMDKIVADAGYESEENYVYLEKKGLRAFIKPSNYEQAKTRNYQKQMQERDSYTYWEEQDCYVHPNGKRFVRVADRVSKKKSGYQTTSKVYRCFDWNEDGQKTKSLYFTEKLNHYRQKSWENITSEEGIIERINRSIQAEGVFSKIKSGLNYHRFPCKGLAGIKAEITFLALGLNINTLLSKIRKADFNPTRYTKNQTA